MNIQGRRLKTLKTLEPGTVALTVWNVALPPLCSQIVDGWTEGPEETCCAVIPLDETLLGFPEVKESC